MRSGRGANHGGASRPRRPPTSCSTSARAAPARCSAATAAEIVFGASMTALTMPSPARSGARCSPATRSSARAWTTTPTCGRGSSAPSATARPCASPSPSRETLELPASAVEAVLSRAHALGGGHPRLQRRRHRPRPRGIVAAAHAAGARVYVDAVHAAPHRQIDVARARLRRPRLLGLQVVRPAHRRPVGAPRAAGRAAARQAPALPRHRPRPLGERHAAVRGAGRRRGRRRLHARHRTGTRCARTSSALLARALEGLDAIPGVHRLRPRRRPHLDADVHRRGPHLGAGRPPRSPSTQVAVWHGNYYAWELERLLGLAPDGAVRAGFVHYNDERDVERLLDAVGAL